MESMSLSFRKYTLKYSGVMGMISVTFKEFRKKHTYEVHVCLKREKERENKAGVVKCQQFRGPR